MQNENLDKIDITKNIETKFVNEISNHITKTNWVKNCPKCEKEQTYTCKKSLNKALILNKCCRKCNHVGTTGQVMSDQQKKKISDHHKKTGVGKWMLGRKLSNETKIKIGNALIGRKQSDHQKILLSIINKGKKHSLDTKLKISIAGIGRKCSDQTREKLRIKAIETMNFRHRPNLEWSPFFNPNACKYFDALNENSGWNLQHALNGGEIQVGQYFLDAYDKERNIVVEYDESHHYFTNGILKPKDLQRQQKIKSKLNCKFYRFNELTNTLYETDFGQVPII